MPRLHGCSRHFFRALFWPLENRYCKSGTTWKCATMKSVLHCWKQPKIARCEVRWVPLSYDNIAWHTATHEALFSSVSIRGTHLAETFRILRMSCKMVSTDPRDMPVLAAICLTLKRRSSITTCSTRAIMSSDWLVHGQGSFGLFSHDVQPSLKCRTHKRTFFTSIMPSLHVLLNCRWISIGFMPRKWRNRIITRCSSNVNIAISVSKTLLQLDLITSIQRVVQCCHLASPNLKTATSPPTTFTFLSASIPEKKIRRP